MEKDIVTVPIPPAPGDWRSPLTLRTGSTVSVTSARQDRPNMVVVERDYPARIVQVHPLGPLLENLATAARHQLEYRR